MVGVQLVWFVCWYLFVYYLILTAHEHNCDMNNQIWQQFYRTHSYLYHLKAFLGFSYVLRDVWDQIVHCSTDGNGQPSPIILSVGNRNAILYKQEYDSNVH